ASKDYIYGQFDSTVGVRTVLGPGEGDAAVLKLLEAEPMGIAVKGDANPRYSYLDPRLGAANSFVKAYRNVAAVGAKPLAAVDSINVGSPEVPDRYWQFVESVAGLAEAAEALGVPIVGGKVSLYNEIEGSGEAIKPVVAVVVLGVIEDVGRAKRAVWRDGDVVKLLGRTRAELGGSEYLWRVFGTISGSPPAIDYSWERELAEVLRKAAGAAAGIHDVGLGGLAAALAKMAANSGVGAEVDICRAPADTARLDAIAYSESNGRALLAGPKDADLPGVPIGEAGGDELVLRCGGTTLYRARVERVRELMSLII
ncbi:MAG: AIR synthase related protein, partial [Thermoproteus sp. AZ2]